MEFIKPRLKPSHSVTRTDNGDIAIGELGPHSYIVRQPPQAFVDLLLLLDGTRTLPRITRALRRVHDVTEQDVAGLIDRLGDALLLDDGARDSAVLSSAERERYDRQMLQFSVRESDGDPAFVYQERVKSQVVCVLGMGGWGTWLSLNLALAGFGTLRLVDGDYVELSNLNRQVLYDDSSVGEPKVGAAQAAIARINPHVNVETFKEFVEPDREQIKRLVDGATLICLCWANQSHFVKDTSEEVVHRVALDHGVPILEIAGDPFDIAVGPLYKNDGTGPCVRCVRPQMQKLWWNVGDDLAAFRKQNAKATPVRATNAWQSAPSLSAVAGIAANEALTLATGYAEPGLSGRRLNISLGTYATATDQFERDPACDWCGR